MSRRLDELGDQTLVALVTFTDPQHLAAYLDRQQLPYPVLIDPDRAAYRAFGLGRATLARVWGLRAARRYIEILRTQGIGGVRRLRRPTEDTRQLGGDFIIAPDGTLWWGHWGEGPDDRPSVDELVGAARAAASRD